MSKRISNRAVIPILFLLYSLIWYVPVRAQNTASGVYAINDFIVDLRTKRDTPALKDHFAERQFYNLGVETCNKKNYNLVRRLAQAAIKDHPTWCAPYVLLGRIAREQFEDDEAIAQFRKGAKVAPLCTLPPRELAIALQHDTHYEQSIAVVDSALKMIGDSRGDEIRLAKSELYYCKASDLTALKRYEEAVGSMEQYYHTAFVYDLNAYRLAEAYLNAKQYANVVKFCNSQIKARPNLLENYYWRGLAHQALGQDKLAIDDLSKFIQRNSSTIAVNSKDRKARVARADLYEKTGQMQLAKAERNYLQREQIDAYNDTLFRDRRK